MSRRIDVELTSDRGDGTWSWRAAGARQPKGVLDASLLYEGAQPGDVVRAEADFDIDGITVVGIQPPKGARQEPARIEVVGVERDFSPITSSLTGRARERAERGEDDRPRRRDDRGGRPGGGGPGGRPGGPAREGGRGPRPTGGRPDRPARPPRPEPPAPKPKPKKLRPARVHRDALLAALSPEQQPIAEQLLRGGMPAVRAALEEQNAKAEVEGGLAVPVDTVLGIAEQLVTRARVADWLDRAEAAKATGEELALRDLRSVVSSADDVARDEATRELAAELRSMLEQRTQTEQAGWLHDIERSLSDGRVVRALRLSSRPPEPGTSFPAELTTRLTEAANAALTADIAPDRWATVLDAVAYSPVRRAVVPAGIPAEPTEELLTAVRKHAGRTPSIATLFGVEPPADKGKGRGERPARAAGRNPNLSRAGGPRNATVPVAGRAGGPPVPPARRIPPPPGRQIGATLPGTPPAASAVPAPDPTAPLAPPSATGTDESAATVGTPEAQPAAPQPTSSDAGADAQAPAAPNEQAAPAAPDGQATAEQATGAPTEQVTAEAAPAAVPTEQATAEAAPADPGASAVEPEAAMAFDAAPSLIDGPAPEAAPAPAALATDEPPVPVEQPATPPPAGAPDGEAQVEGAVADPLEMPASPTDPLGAPAAEAGAPTEPTDGDAGTPEVTAPTSPLDAPAGEAAPSPSPEAPDAAVTGGDTDHESAAPEATGGDATSQPTGPLDAPAAEVGAPTAAPEEGDVALSAPSDSALPEDAPTGGDAEPAPGGATTDELDAIVSQAAEGPFEPPADPPVDGAPNSAVGTVAAQHEGHAEQDRQQT